MLIGLMASLLGAFFQATCYQFTQHCQRTHGLKGTRQLLAVHLLMGLVSLAYLVFTGAWTHFDSQLLWPLVKVNGTYLLAQWALFKAIHDSSSDIVSPLLALKIPVLVLIGFEFASYNIQQWVAIGMILGLALFISSLAGRLTWRPLVWISLASFGYCLSDLSITQMSASIPGSSFMDRMLLTTALNYSFCGLLCLPFVRMLSEPLKSMHQVRWIAASWLAGVFFLLSGFNMVGVVHGNVVQSLRGVIGVIMAWLILKYVRDYQALGLGQWPKKLMAAWGMVVAVGLFYL